MRSPLNVPALALAATALAASISGQGAVPATQISQTNPVPGLNPPAVAGAFLQIHTIHLPSDPPNVYYTAMTTTGLQPMFGGVGGQDVVTGTYDVLTDTFTANAEAAALNASGTDFGLMLHHSGLYAAWDRLPGPPHFARRAAVGQPWVDMGAINGLPSQSYYDPALADYQGQTHLLHVLGREIAMTPIDVNTGQLTGPSRVIVRNANASSTANSPTPVVDSVGELIGLTHHDLTGNDNDHYLSLDLDPNTLSVEMNNTTTWTNNGGFIGGRFFDAESTAPYHIFAIDTYWFTGGRGPVGGSMEVRAFSPPTTAAEVYVSFMVLASGFLPNGQMVPPLGGLLGINPVGITTIPLGQHNNTDGTVTTVIPIPNNRFLRNRTIPVQSVTLQSTTGQLSFGSTAALTIE